MKPATGIHALLIGLLLSVSAPALAVYKCEANGKVTYSDAPCAGGKVLDIDTTPPADAAKAGKQAAREKTQMKRLENERRKREAREEKAQQQAAKAQAVRQRKCAGLERRQKWADEDAAAATGRAADKARRRARRIAEEYEAECKQRGRELSITG